MFHMNLNTDKKSYVYKQSGIEYITYKNSKKQFVTTYFLSFWNFKVGVYSKTLNDIWTYIIFSSYYEYAN